MTFRIFSVIITVVFLLSYFVPVVSCPNEPSDVFIRSFILFMFFFRLNASCCCDSKKIYPSRWKIRTAPRERFNRKYRKSRGARVIPIVQEERWRKNMWVCIFLFSSFNSVSSPCNPVYFVSFFCQWKGMVFIRLRERERKRKCACWTPVRHLERTPQIWTLWAFILDLAAGR